MNFRYILFDLDGTITNPKSGITKSVAYALEKFGIFVENLEELRVFIGPPLRNSFREFYGLGEVEAEQAVAYYREYYQEQGIFDCFLYPGIPELLQKLKAQGRKVILATSKPTEYAIQLLEHFQLIDYFDFVGGSSMDAGRTEKADVIRYILEHYSAEPEESRTGADQITKQMVMIGDRKFDYEGAKEFGIPCILVSYGYGERAELEACHPLSIQNSAAAIWEFLI